MRDSAKASPHHTTHPAHASRLRARMIARSPDEPHRVSTPLELFFDLVFVVAIAQAANGLHHAITGNHAAQSLAGYLMVFFAIWWAWMNFSWFASAYDCDDVPYRLTVFVQITGALSLAAGVTPLFEQRVPNLAVLGGYVLMRLAMVVQWLRASAGDPAHRVTARRYAIGIAVLQVAWVATLAVPHLWVPAFLVLATVELLVPAWAESVQQTPWHPHHISERYGLLTLIVLGESILAASVAIQQAIAAGGAVPALVPVIVGGLLTVYSMWWLYFDRPVHDLLTSFGKAMLWGYGHYFVFASAAAVGAGFAAAVDEAAHHAEISAVTAAAAVAIPVAVFIASLWLLHDRPEHRQSRPVGAIAGVLILLSPLTGQGVLLTGVILASFVAAKLVLRRHAEREDSVADVAASSH
jgi:low temperature requirement protein LtrA